MLDNSNKIYGWVRNIKGDSELKSIEIYYEGKITYFNDIKVNQVHIGDFVECINGEVHVLNSRRNIYKTDNSIYNPFMQLRGKKYDFMKVKSNIIRYSLEFFYNRDFFYVETPCLAKSIGEYTEEEFKVIASLFKGEYYTLNQSPQIFKQLLMAGGIKKYFQIARNFRAEIGGLTHLQEFSQIDVEMAMYTQDEILSLIEKYVQFLFKKILNIHLEIPFPRYDYVTICEKFKVTDPAEVFSDKKNIETLQVYQKEKWNFAWIVNFPYANKDTTGNFIPIHHIMSRPYNYRDAWEKELDKIICSGYDLIINGIEIAGGDLRIYDYDQQRILLKRLNYSEEKISNIYTPLLRGLAAAMPPHGGFAFGLERLAMILAETEKISDVVAFPKTISCRDEFFNAPTSIE